MKKILPLLLAVWALWPTRADARCMSADLRIYPKTGATGVPLNPQILVIPYGYKDLEKVGQLLDGAYFVAGRHKVALSVERLPQSAKAFKNAYYLLKPQQTLRPRTRYRLKLAVKRPETHPLTVHYDKLKAYRFRTVEAVDQRAPSQLKLVSRGYSYRRLGCGPAEEILLKISGLADDQTPTRQLRFVLQVEEKMKGQPARSFELMVPTWVQGQLSLGHGMCSGNYQLVKGASYTIRVAAVDWAGNRGPLSEAVQVKAATP